MKFPLVNCCVAFAIAFLRFCNIRQEVNFKEFEEKSNRIFILVAGNQVLIAIELVIYGETKLDNFSHLDEIQCIE